MSNFKVNRSIKNGNFSQISNDVLLDSRLEDGAKVLFQILLNNSTEWTIRLDYYTNKLGWNPHKMASIINNLTECGYMKKKKEKNPKGHWEYFYTLDETGSLLSTKEEPKQESSPIVEAELPVKQVELSKPKNVTPEPKQLESLFLNYSKPITNEQKLEIYQLRVQSIYNRSIINELDNMKYKNEEPETIISTIKERLGIAV